MRHLNARLMAASALSILAGSYALYRTGSFDSRGANMQVLADAQQAFAGIPIASIAELQSLDNTRAVVAPFGVQNTPPDGAGTANAITELVAQFLYHRFGNSSADQYIQWRRSLGYRLKSMDEMRGIDVDEDFPVVVGSPFPEAESVAGLFAAYWDASLDYGDGFNRPIGVAKDAKGLLIVFGVLHNIADQRPLLDGQLSADVWHGRGGGAMRMWFAPSRTLAEIIAEEGHAVMAHAGMVLAYKDGSRRPLVLTLSWNRGSRRWEIQAATVYNFPPGSALSTMEL